MTGRFEAVDLMLLARASALGQNPNPPGPPLTGGDMCGLISQHWRSLGVDMTPEQIWNYSPTGELFMVFEWGRAAISWQQRCRALTHKV